MLTINQAWIKIAEAYESDDRTEEQKTLTHHGICDAVDVLWNMKYIHKEQRSDMNDLIITEMGEQDKLYFWPLEAEYDKNRAEFCRERINDDE